MYVPVTLGQPASALAPVEIASTAPARTALTVRRAQLDVLGDHRATVAGALLRGSRSGSPVRWSPCRVSVGMAGAPWHVRAPGRGGFVLSYVPRQLGSWSVRLRFAGDASERAHVVASAG